MCKISDLTCQRCSCLAGFKINWIHSFITSKLGAVIRKREDSRPFLGSRAAPRSCPELRWCRSRCPCHQSSLHSLSPAINTSPPFEKILCRILLAACTNKTWEVDTQRCLYWFKKEAAWWWGQQTLKFVLHGWFTNRLHLLCRCSSLLASCRPLEAHRGSAGEEEAASENKGTCNLFRIKHNIYLHFTSLRLFTHLPLSRAVFWLWDTWPNFRSTHSRFSSFVSVSHHTDDPVNCTGKLEDPLPPFVFVASSIFQWTLSPEPLFHTFSVAWLLLLLFHEDAAFFSPFTLCDTKPVADIIYIMWKKLYYC